MPEIPTLFTINTLARRSGVNTSVVMRLAAEGKIRPVAFIKYGYNQQALFPDEAVATVFDECQPARSGQTVFK
jgi:hypothetical protein